MTAVDDSFTAPGKVYPYILARNVVPGISYLNLGRASRLRTPKLEPIILLSQLLLNPRFTYLGTNFALKCEVLPVRGYQESIQLSGAYATRQTS
jgi:hypothetical protein